MSEMTTEKAIAEIENSGLYGNQVHQETLKFALTALEKQVATEPERKNKTLYCPSCHNALSNSKHCTDCGQALKFPEVKNVSN
jgi:uncharacterized paraquat-inducible protein A